MPSYLERVVEGVIMFPIIFYLCKVSQNKKTKNQYMCLIYKQWEYDVTCVHCRNTTIVDDTFGLYL